MANGKYQLQIAHFFPGDHYLEAGTIVGDGTDFPVEGPPSLNMTPLDEVAQGEIKKYNTDRKRPDIPVPLINPVGANLVNGPGQVITTTLSSGPPRNEGASRVPGPPGYNEGAPAIRGTLIGSQRLGPTELKIQEERAQIEEEDRQASMDAAKAANDSLEKEGLERARAHARGAAMIPAEELAQKSEADKKAAQAKTAQSALKAPSVPTGGAGAPTPVTVARPGFKPTLDNSLPKPG